MTEYDTEPQILGDKKKSFWKTFPILSEGRPSPRTAKWSLQDLGLFWRIISGNGTSWGRQGIPTDFTAKYLLHACNWHLNSRLDLTSKKLTLDKRYLLFVSTFIGNYPFCEISVC